MRRSAHIVQLIDRKDIDKDRPDPLLYDWSEDDSSEQEDSSGDESQDEGRQIRRSRLPRANYTKARAQRKYTRHVNRVIKLGDRYNSPEEMARRGARKDFIVLEYMENGDLSNLIYKLVEDKATGGRIPNRVLWAFWLCRTSNIPLWYKYPTIRRDGLAD